MRFSNILKTVKADLQSLQTEVPQKPFGLVLGGGGARGLAHVGVLRALNHMGYYPAAITGVSMGAVVGATYALNDNWYRELVDMDISGFPAVPNLKTQNVKTVLKNLLLAPRAARDIVFGLGSGEESVDWGRGVLESLTQGKNLEDGRIPIFTSATDILTGERVVTRKGDAVNAVYASSALAGILPPLPQGEHLLMDGAYSDMAPVDTLRRLGLDTIIAIDPSQPVQNDVPKNGLAMLLRSYEIMQASFASKQFAQADIVIRPEFSKTVGVMDFEHKRDCVAAGARSVRRIAPILRKRIGTPAAQDGRGDV